MTKNQIQKAIAHIVRTDQDTCSCNLCQKQENGTYLNGLIDALK